MSIYKKLLPIAVVTTFTSLAPSLATAGPDRFLEDRADSSSSSSSSSSTNQAILGTAPQSIIDLAEKRFALTTKQLDILSLVSEEKLSLESNKHLVPMINEERRTCSQENKALLTFLNAHDAIMDKLNYAKSEGYNASNMFLTNAIYFRQPPIDSQGDGDCVVPEYIPLPYNKGSEIIVGDGADASASNLSIIDVVHTIGNNIIPSNGFDSFDIDEVKAEGLMGPLLVGHFPYYLKDKKWTPNASFIVGNGYIQDETPDLLVGMIKTDGDGKMDWRTFEPEDQYDTNTIHSLLITEMIFFEEEDEDEDTQD